MDSNDLNEINDHYYELVLITYKPFAVTAGSGFPGGGPLSNVPPVWGLASYQALILLAFFAFIRTIWSR